MHEAPRYARTKERMKTPPDNEPRRRRTAPPQQPANLADENMPRRVPKDSSPPARKPRGSQAPNLNDGLQTEVTEPAAPPAKGAATPANKEQLGKGKTPIRVCPFCAGLPEFKAYTESNVAQGCISGPLFRWAIKTKCDGCMALLRAAGASSSCSANARLALFSQTSRSLLCAWRLARHYTPEVTVGIDPKSLNAIRLVKDRTSGSSHSLAGPITPKYMTLAIPQVGKHRGWIDHVVERVLCEVISAYRLNGNKTKPFWDGPAYRIDRHDLSIRLSCRPRNISKALKFLERQKFLTLVHKARFKRGEPCGTLVYAIPNVEAIDRALIEVKQVVESYLAEAKEAEAGQGATSVLDHTKVPNSSTQPVELGHSAKPKSGTQPVEQQPQSLNVPPTAQNDAVGHAAGQGGHQSKSSKTHLPRSVAEGGCGGFADAAAAFAGSTSPSDHSPAPAAAHTGQSASGHASTAPAPDPAYIEKKVNRFCYYWTEAGRRTGQIDVLAIEKREREALRKFFTVNPDSTGWFAAVATLAWQAGEDVKKKGSHDPAWACRRSKDIQTFLKLLSRILTELGSNGYKVNAYRHLRWWFTDSELRNQGFKVNAGLGVLDAVECWENTPDALAYYEDNGLEIPPEVRAANA